MTSVLIVRFGPTGCCLLSFSLAAFKRHERLPCCSSRPGDVSQEVSVCLCPLGLLVLLDSGGGVGVGQSLPFSSFGWFLAMVIESFAFLVPVAFGGAIVSGVRTGDWVLVSRTLISLGPCKVRVRIFFATLGVGQVFRGLNSPFWAVLGVELLCSGA